MIHPSKEQSHKIISPSRRAQNTATGKSSLLNSPSPHRREHAPFLQLPNQIYQSESSSIKQSSHRERTFSGESLLFPSKLEDISRMRANTYDENDLIGTTISFGKSNIAMDDDESYSSGHSESQLYHPASADYRNGIMGSQRRRHRRSSQRKWFDIEIGRYFQWPLHESAMTITSFSSHSKRSQNWKVTIIRITLFLSMFLAFSSSVRNSFFLKSHLPSVMDQDNASHELHTVKDLSTWGLTLEESKFSADASYNDLQESSRKKRRPVMYAANNLSTHQHSLPQDGYISRPKKLKEFVMTDDEIKKRTALLEAEHYTTLRQNKMNSDTVFLYIGVAFVGAIMISVYKRNRRIFSDIVHRHYI